MPVVLTRVLFGLLLAWLALAPLGRSAVAAPAVVDDAVESDSPRALVEDFLALGDRGEFEEAAKFLDLPREEAARGPELARRLHAVLSRLSSTTPELLSGQSGGDTDDGLPRGVERVGWVGGSTKGEDREPQDDPSAVPVLMQHRARAEPRWVFSRRTVKNIDAWYDALGDRWLIDTLPEPMLRTAWGGLAYWQWLALPLLLLMSWAVGLLGARASRGLLYPFVARTHVDAKTLLLRRFSGPLRVAWMLVVFRVALPLLSLLPRADDTVRDVLGAAMVLLVFWGALRSVDLLADLLARSDWASARVGTRALLPLGARVVKVLVGALAIVAVFAKLDYPIASLIAGLGIGGLAVALAAQKSFENLIGAFALGADQPFLEGDLVKVEDFLGTVESIGLRSTRFRTFERTVITIPNGKLSEMRIETYSARDRLRMFCTIGLTYDATAQQLRAVLDGVRGVLEAHPKTWPDRFTVGLVRFGSSSLDIEVMAWFMTTDPDEFLLIREQILLEFMGVVEANGASFAFPTQTVHMVRSPS